MKYFAKGLIGIGESFLYIMPILIKILLVCIMFFGLFQSCSKGDDMDRGGIVCWECEIKCGGIRDTLIWNAGEVPPPSYNDGYGNVCGLQNCARR